MSGIFYALPSYYPISSQGDIHEMLTYHMLCLVLSAQIDYAFERIVNWFFYFFLVIVAVSILGISIWTVRVFYPAKFG